MGCACELRLITRQRAVSPTRYVRRSVAGHERPLITNVRRGLQPDEDLPWIVGADHLAELRRRQAGPLGDDEHPIVDGGATRIDDQPAGQLTEGHGRPHRRGPVVIRAGLIDPELHLAGVARRDCQRRTGRAIAGAQAMHLQQHVQVVAKRHVDERALPPRGSTARAPSAGTRLPRTPRLTAEGRRAPPAATIRGRREATASACRPRACRPGGGCRWPRPVASSLRTPATAGAGETEKAEVLAARTTAVTSVGTEARNMRRTSIRGLRQRSGTWRSMS